MLPGACSGGSVGLLWDHPSQLGHSTVVSGRQTPRALSCRIVGNDPLEDRDALVCAPVRLLYVALALVWAALPLCAADWPHWRGPERDSSTPETSGWDEGAWPPGEPAWQTDVGQGSATPVIADGRLYVHGWADGTDSVRCLDAPSGRPLWASEYPALKHGRHHRGDENLYAGPQSTPEFDAATGYLYTLGVDGDLNCWSTREDGRRVWGMSLYETFAVPQRPDVGGDRRDYGYTTSPMVYGDLLLVEVGAEAGNLIAVDKRTGRRIWASQCKDPAGHSGGPARIDVAGIPCAAVLTLRNLVVVRLDPGHEGETLAIHDWCTDFANSIASPTVVGDCVILSSGYNRSRTVKLRVAPGKTETLWESRAFSKVCSPTLCGDYVLLAWQKLRCLSLQTGEKVWEGGSFGDEGSCVVTQDGRAIVLGQKQLVLVQGPQRSPGGYTELSRRGGLKVGRCWAHVVLAEGRLYVRDTEGRLQCYELLPPGNGRQ